MQRPLPWFWIGLLLLILVAPTPAGRLLLDLLGGLTLTLLGLPLLLGTAGFLTWQIRQRRLRTCPACGFRAIGLEQCPACGSPFDPSSGLGGGGSAGAPGVDASTVTIDVEVIQDSD